METGLFIIAFLYIALSVSVVVNLFSRNRQRRRQT
jgi:hypothetical protein